MIYAFFAVLTMAAVAGPAVSLMPQRTRERLWDEFVELPGLAAVLAAWGLVITLNYGIAVIIFRYAFGVRLWNPFG